MVDVRLSENDEAVTNLPAMKHWQIFFLNAFNLTNPFKFPHDTYDLQETFINVLQFTFINLSHVDWVD